MIVRAADDSVLERIHTKGLLLGDADLESLANEIALAENAPRVLLDGIGVLETGKSVV